MPRKPNPERKQELNDMQMLGLTSPKQMGEAVEAAFLAKATMLGFPVLKPWGESRPYDFAGGEWAAAVAGAGEVRDQPSRYAVQYKGGGQRGIGIRWMTSIFWRRYVIKKNLWYVVPADAFIPRVTVHFNYGPKSQGMFEIYRETWCLLTCSARARGKGDIPEAVPMRGRCRSGAWCVRRGGERRRENRGPVSRFRPKRSRRGLKTFR